MKKQIFSILVLCIFLLPALVINSNPNTLKSSINKRIQNSVYVGDTEYGAAAGYAVYATSDAAGAEVGSVYQYSTVTSFTASGYLYSKSGGLSANLTASNGYSWNSPPVQ